MLALMLVNIALQSSGRIVFDRSTDPPAGRVVWGLQEWLPALAVALMPLACIYVSMCKRWDFEVVGWALLVAFLLMGTLASGM